MQLHQAHESFERAGGRLVIVGNGSPYFIAAFRSKSGFDGAIFTDPNRTAYRALRLRRDLRSSFNTRSLRRAVTAYRQGHRQTRTQGDAWQQGGVFVIGSSGDIVFRYPSEYAGDHPPVHVLLTALGAAQRESPP